jgi:hypothetical protein
MDGFDGSLIADPIAGSPSGTGDVEFAGGEVRVPGTLDDGVVLADTSEAITQIRLPNARGAGTAEVLDSGAITFPGDASANTIIVAETGVQMLTTIANADAPRAYSYQLDLKPGFRLLPVEGGAQVIDAEGSLVLSTGAAWAKDARGTDIPTSYEIEGSTLTQIVDHTAIADAQYPIVADPIWLAPAVIKCLVGLGIRGPDIVRIATLGTPGAIGAAFGRAAVACVFGK